MSKAFLENLHQLREFWLTVPKRSVRLDNWTCGSFACLGGHMARAGLFGIEETDEGTIILKREHQWYHGGEIAAHLFGDSRLFDSRTFSTFNPGNGKTNYDIALGRIDHLINLYSEVYA